MDRLSRSCAGLCGAAADHDPLFRRTQPLDPFATRILAEDGTRFAIWRDAVATLKAHPLFGIGPGIRVAEGWSAHNTWLNLCARIGLVPLISALLMVLALRTAVRARLIGVAMALTLLLVESLYSDVEDMRHLWLLLGLGLAPFGRADQASMIAAQRRP